MIVKTAHTPWCNQWLGTRHRTRRNHQNSKRTLNLNKNKKICISSPKNGWFNVPKRSKDVVYWLYGAAKHGWGSVPIHPTDLDPASSKVTVRVSRLRMPHLTKIIHKFFNFCISLPVKDVLYFNYEQIHKMLRNKNWREILPCNPQSEYCREGRGWSCPCAGSARCSLPGLRSLFSSPLLPGPVRKSQWGLNLERVPCRRVRKGTFEN